MDTSTLERRPVGSLVPLAQATVAVLAGGRSNEREVSLQSAREVVEALRRTPEAQDSRGPGRVLAVEITREGNWVVAGRTYPPAEALGVLSDVDVFFFGLHGGDGENGVLQGLLSASGRAFTGSGVLASALAMDKVDARDLMERCGARLARAELVHTQELAADPKGVLQRLEGLGTNGWVVKPRSGGSSVGCAVVHDGEALLDGLRTALAWEEEALVEERIVGTEATAGVVTDPHGQEVTLPAIEIRPHAGRFFDYEEKYSESGAEETCPPRSLSPRTQERLAYFARLAHRRLHCVGYSRSDFMVPEGEDEPVFLETNTLPGLTPRSLVPLAARTAGIDYRTLCLWISGHGLACGTERGGR